MHSPNIPSSRCIIVRTGPHDVQHGMEITLYEQHYINTHAHTHPQQNTPKKAATISFQYSYVSFILIFVQHREKKL
jgi:hypothetical protein